LYGSLYNKIVVCKTPEMYNAKNKERLQKRKIFILFIIICLPSGTALYCFWLRNAFKPVKVKAAFDPAKGETTAMADYKF
jgi:RsiW-degrading membrane proteinase PrsW (M82 family)